MDRQYPGDYVNPYGHGGQIPNYEYHHGHGGYYPDYDYHHSHGSMHHR